MYRRTRPLSILALLLILFALLAGCAPQSRNSDTRTVTIAVVETYPGDVGNPNPQSAYAGILLAAEEMKAHDGINLEVVPYSDLGNAEIARQIAEEIVQSNAIAVIGHSTIETSRAAAENLIGFYPLNLTKPTTSSGPNDQKFLELVKQFPGDIRWMFTEISNEYPRADVLIRRDLYRMAASQLTPEEAAQNLQNGLGEWYEPAQNCR